MSPLTPAALIDDVTKAVSAVSDPELRRPLGELDMVRGVSALGDGVRVEIALTIAGCPAADRIEQDVRAAAEAAAGEAPVTIEVGVMSPQERKALTERLRGGKRAMPFGPDSLTRVVAVTSGKGGVGKSTVTANLAVALAQRGRRVGLIDADVHGFSIPGILGLVRNGTVAKPTQVGDLIVPPIAHAVATISIGMFLDDQAAAVAWRGPMLHRTVQQFLTDVYFGDLDILLIDMPPGTGDVAISVGQLLPHAEVLVVTTPQPAAADVAIRSGTVARQTGQRVIGVVENMGPLSLPDGAKLAMFGEGGGARVAESLSASAADAAAVPLAATIPLSEALREGGDAGEPVVVADPDDAASVAIGTLADFMAASQPGLAGRSLPFRPE